MSFKITLFSPKHYFWNDSMNRIWFYRPDECGSGGVGFCVPGLHVVFTWGHR